jgi:hypothetical protein
MVLVCLARQGDLYKLLCAPYDETVRFSSMYEEFLLSWGEIKERR